MKVNFNGHENLRPLAEQVVASYLEGIPVVLIAKDEGILHGGETLEVIRQTGAELRVLTIYGVDREEFEDTHLPELFEAIRETWLKDGLSEKR